MSDSWWVPIRDKIVFGVKTFFYFGTEFVLPVVMAFGQVFGIPTGYMSIIAAIPSWMDAFEIAMPETGKGPSRKEQVLASAAAMMDQLDKQLTGGAARSFDKYQPVIELVIERTVQLLKENTSGVIAPDPPGPPVVGSGISAPIDLP